MTANWDTDLALKGWVDVEDVLAQISKTKADVLQHYAPGLLVAERLIGQVAELRSELAAMRDTITGLRAEVDDLKAELAKLRLGVPADLGGSLPPAPGFARRLKYTDECKLRVLRRLARANDTPKEKRRYAEVRLRLANLLRAASDQPQRLALSDDDEMVIVAGEGVRAANGHGRAR